MKRLFAQFLTTAGLCTTIATSAGAQESVKIYFPGYSECVYQNSKSLIGTDSILAKTQLRTSKASFYPSISSSVSNSKTFTPSSPSESVGEITLEQKVIDFSQFKNISSKKSLEEAEQYFEENQVLNQVIQSASDFYNLLSEQDRKEILTKRSERIDQALKIAKKVSRLKFVNDADLLVIQSQKKQLEIDFTENRSSESRLRRQLTVNGNLNQSLQYLASTVKTLPHKKSFLEQIDAIISHHPSIKEIESRIKSTQEAESSISNELIPSLDLSIGYQRLLHGTDTSTFGSGKNNLYGQISLTAPLFDQNLRSIRKDGQKRSRVVYEAVLENRKNSLRQELTSLWNEVNSYEEAIQIADQQYEIAAKAHRASLALIQIGKSDYLSLKTAEDNLLDVELQLKSLKREHEKRYMQLWLLERYREGLRKPFPSKGKPSFCAR